jgi:hypothetical protein
MRAEENEEMRDRGSNFRFAVSPAKQKLSPWRLAAYEIDTSRNSSDEP